jgi:hypothetical protein
MTDVLKYSHVVMADPISMNSIDQNKHYEIITVVRVLVKHEQSKCCCTKRNVSDE